MELVETKLLGISGDKVNSELVRTQLLSGDKVNLELVQTQLLSGDKVSLELVGTKLLVISRDTVTWN